MKNIMKYLTCRYETGARGEGGAYDCWGLVRDVRHKVYGKPLMPSMDYTVVRRVVRKDDALKETGLEPICNPVDGSLAGVFRGDLCVHIGIVIKSPCGALHVLEATPHAIQIVPIDEFISIYEMRDFRISYYD